MLRRPPRSTLFPYRRSSDLQRGRRHRRPESDLEWKLGDGQDAGRVRPDPEEGGDAELEEAAVPDDDVQADRKSTRLNSSHSSISYAVFCLKKKKHNL